MIRTTCGIDTIRISRIGDVLKRKGGQFLDRVYTPSEQQICVSRVKGQTASFAARFACKEAVAKALGTGIGREGVRFSDIEILSDERNRPILRLHGAARDYYLAQGGTGSEVSLSHDGDQAVAVCMMQFTVQESESDT